MYKATGELGSCMENVPDVYLLNSLVSDKQLIKVNLWHALDGKNHLLVSNGLSSYVLYTRTNSDQK